MAREGVRLVLCAGGDELEYAASEISNETGVEVKTVKVDLLDSNQNSAKDDKSLAAFSKIYILVLNAR